MYIINKEKIDESFKTNFQKEDIAKFQNKDAHLERTLRIRDFLALGVGTIVSTAILRCLVL